MTKTMCIILGLVFFTLGILGITGIVPMLTRDPIYINIGEIVLGGLALLVGVYARQERRYDQQEKEFSRQIRDKADRMRQDHENLIKESEQGRIINFDQQQQENDQLRKQLEQQKQEEDQQSEHNE